MRTAQRVEIIGAPVPCIRGPQDTWRELSQWIAQEFEKRYGPAVSVTYYDLYDEERPPLPAELEVPVVLVNGELLSSGGKLSMPAIRKRLEALGVGSASG